MTQHSQQSRAQHSTILGHFALVKADAEGHFIDYARSAGTFLDVKFVRSIQIGAVCSSEWAVHSLCIPESEHLNYKLIMSGVAHPDALYALVSAAVVALDGHAGTEAVAKRPPLRLCGQAKDQIRW